MKHLIISICILLLGGEAFSQKVSKPNCLYTEAGGNGIWGSLNYERQILKVSGLAARIGLGFNTDYYDTILRSNLQFHYPLILGFDYFVMLDSNKSYIDVSFGETWQTKIGSAYKKRYRDRDNIYGSFMIGCGYRRIFRNNLMFRISLLLVILK